jgi:hypothetical protein
MDADKASAPTLGGSKGALTAGVAFPQEVLEALRQKAGTAKERYA